MTKVRIKGAPLAQREALYALVEEPANSKVFGIWRLRTRSWYFTKNSKRRKKGKETLWEPPSYYTEEGTELTASKMTSFLKNKGYFNATVESEVKINGRRDRGAEVTYIIKQNKPYKIKSIQSQVEDADLYDLLSRENAKSLIQVGQKFESQNLSDERERIFNLLRNEGYYDFSREYIYFDLDSNLQEHSIEVSLGLKNPDIYERHALYRISAVTFKVSGLGASETKVISDGIQRIGGGNSFIDDLLFKSLDFEINGLYKQIEVENSLRNLRNIRLFKFVDVVFNPSKDSANSGDISLEIRLSPYKRFQSQMQAEIITSEQNGVGLSFDGRLYGLAGSLSFRDINFLKRGIQMETKLRASTEISVSNYPDLISNNEINLSNSYYFAKPFLSKLLPTKVLKSIQQSSLSLSIFKEENPDFRRYTANISAGYMINKGNFKHYILPLDFSLISTDIKSNDFQTFLDTSSNLFLRNLFDNHTLVGSKWALYFSDRKLGSTRNYTQITANLLETGGSLFSVLGNWIGSEVEGDQANTYKKSVFGMHYFQYVKTDLDVAYHKYTVWNNEIVLRGYAGFIIPFGNTPNAVPFEKRYYAGGSNSVRGWSVRNLGPGSYSPEGEDDDFVYFHSGDIKLEGNFEYRFAMSRLVKMAVFMDFGNIWNHSRNNFQVDGGDWQWNRFYKEFAVAGGLGIRFDFNYFVFRTDIGMPFRDPSVQSNKNGKWFPSTIYRRNNFDDMFQLNFGIGYPF